MCKDRDIRMILISFILLPLLGKESNIQQLKRPTGHNLKELYTFRNTTFSEAAGKCSVFSLDNKLSLLMK